MLPSFLGEQDQVAPLFSAKSVDGVRAYELARKQFRERGLAKTEVIEDFDHTVAETLNVQRITISELELLSLRQAQGPAGNAANAGRTQPQQSEDGLGRNLTASRPSIDGERPNPRINVADISGLDLVQAEIRIACSKGTYIRALARDLGEALGSGAFLNSLRRTKSGGFDAETALKISEAMDLLAI